MAPELRVHVRRVLSKALSESPAQRFASASAFVAALSALNALPEPIVASALPTPVPAPRSPDEPAALTLLPVVDAHPTPLPAAFDEFDLSHVIQEDSEPVVSPPVEPPPPPDPPPAPIRRAKSRTVAMPVVKPAEPDLLAGTDAPTGARGGDASLEIEPRFRAIEPESARAPVAAFTLPPPIPWVAFAAILVAGLVIGAAIDHQWMTSRAASPAPSSHIEPPPAVPAGKSETEVSVGDPAAADPAAGGAPAGADAGQSGRSEPSQAPATLLGKIAVRSTPSGAMVTIDGKLAGRTPLTSTGLSLAGHAVVVARPGYASDTRRVTLSRRAPSSSLNVTLKAERPPVVATTGSASVDTRPRGARITIDGRVVGQSPIRVPGLSPGRHTVQIDLAGYKPLVTPIDVKAGETARVAVTLEIR
jgi:hypothetical protein